MKTSSTVAFVFAALSLGGMALATTPAVAQSHIVPMGDTVDITPPIDLTPGQIRRARPEDRAVLQGRSAYVARPAPRHPETPGIQVRH